MATSPDFTQYTLDGKAYPDNPFHAEDYWVKHQRELLRRDGKMMEVILQNLGINTLVGPNEEGHRVCSPQNDALAIQIATTEAAILAALYPGSVGAYGLFRALPLYQLRRWLELTTGTEFGNTIINVGGGNAYPEHMAMFCIPPKSDQLQTFMLGKSHPEKMNIAPGQFVCCDPANVDSLDSRRKYLRYHSIPSGKISLYPISAQHFFSDDPVSQAIRNRNPYSTLVMHRIDPNLFLPESLHLPDPSSTNKAEYGKQLAHIQRGMVKITPPVYNLVDSFLQKITPCAGKKAHLLVTIGTGNMFTEDFPDTYTVEYELRRLILEQIALRCRENPEFQVTSHCLYEDGDHATPTQKLLLRHLVAGRCEYAPVGHVLATVN